MSRLRRLGPSVCSSPFVASRAPPSCVLRRPPRNRIGVTRHPRLLAAALRRGPPLVGQLETPAAAAAECGGSAPRRAARPPAGRARSPSVSPCHPRCGASTRGRRPPSARRRPRRREPACTRFLRLRLLRPTRGDPRPGAGRPPLRRGKRTLTTRSTRARR